MAIFLTKWSEMVRAKGCNKVRGSEPFAVFESDLTARCLPLILRFAKGFPVVHWGFSFEVVNWVVVSNIFYFHPENWGRFPF